MEPEEYFKVMYPPSTEVKWNGIKLTVDYFDITDTGNYYGLSDGSYVSERELLKGGCTGHE